MSEDAVVAKRTVESYLNEVSYADDPLYVPSDFALEFVTFIKLVNGSSGEENLTPVIHYRILDQLTSGGQNIANMCARGTAKTTLLAEYLFLYLAVYGVLPKFGKVNYALYVSDSIENGVKKMRLRLERRRENSPFLLHYIPDVRFTDIRWYFKNADGNEFVVTGHGAKALPLGATLLTEEGTTTIGTCAVGDKIFGADGRLTRIIAKSEVFHKPVYEIGLADGRSIRVSEDHINTVIEKENAQNTARCVEKNLTTAELLKRDLFLIRDRGHRITKERLFFIRNCEPVQYPTRTFAVDPYSLGVILGDGRIRRDCGSVELTAHKDDLPFYRKQIPYTFGRIQVDSRNSNVLTQSIRGLGPALTHFGLKGHGDDKFIPDEYLRGSVEQRLSLLQGLMDTDGTIGKRKVNSVTSFCSNSLGLIHGIKTLVQSLGGHTIIGRTGKRAYRIQIHLNMPVFRLPRKAVKQQIGSKQNKVAIEYIKPITQVSTQCIAVDNEEHQFLTGEFIRTHNTGVRGTVELNTRPQLAILDDLISDEDARSATVIASVEDTVYKAIDYALHPTRQKIIWSGTPFNARDPLYKAIESGAWAVNVFPICEKFPCSKDEFVSAWPDRFPYSYVQSKYDKAMKLGKINTFNQELMLRIMSEEERLILDGEISWYKRSLILANKNKFNFYITTDFATKAEEANDYSVISVWALNYKGHWFWVDGICRKQLMDKNIDDLFRLVQLYNPQQVGIEVSGQQAGFIPWIQERMLDRNVYFNLASEGNKGKPGILPTTNKMVRFNIVLPWFKSRQIFFPTEMKNTPVMMEFIDELTLASLAGFKSKHDDCLDTISMLGSLTAWRPSEEIIMQQDQDGIWEMDYEEKIEARIESYIV